MAGNPMHHLQLPTCRKNPFCISIITINPPFPSASISEVLNMSTAHQSTPGPSANPPQPTANLNPSTGSSSATSAVLATRNPQNLDVTMMANAINALVKLNLPSRVKIREPNPFGSSNPKKLHTFLLQCKLNFWIVKISSRTRLLRSIRFFPI